MMRGWIDVAVAGGARREAACDVLGVSARTMQRWHLQDGGEDGRSGPRHRPANALSEAEQRRVLEVVHRPEHRDLSPKVLVPALADRGLYVASESTVYRLLRKAGQSTHRGGTRAPMKREVPAHVATGPNQVWSWDITYLPTRVRGIFFYLYLVLDVWSRRIMGWAVYPEESMDHAAAFIAAACEEAGIDPQGLVLHADNGGPMKGSTMLATLHRLGVVPSFSRPRVSNDNPFSEAIFRTLKYVPTYPQKPFATCDSARAWVTTFEGWYNTQHLHSGIRFVTPDDRHHGRDVAILARRHAVYAGARAQHPARWSGATRDWTRPQEVFLNAHERKAAAREARVAKAVARPMNGLSSGSNTEVGGRSPSKTQDAHRGSRSRAATPASPGPKEVPLI